MWADGVSTKLVTAIFGAPFGRQVAALVLALLTITCTKHPPPVVRQPALRPIVQQVEKRVSLIENRLSEQDAKLVRITPAQVSTEDPGYDVANTRFGPFVITCDSATPYLDGYRVRLAVGNLTSATFNGATLHVAWGPKFPDVARPTTQQVEKWSESLKSRDVSVTEAFKPGAYTSVDLTLTPATAEEVKTISVGLELNQLSMRQTPRASTLRVTH